MLSAFLALISQTLGDKKRALLPRIVAASLVILIAVSLYAGFVNQIVLKDVNAAGAGASNEITITSFR